jgi:hypothetical protein
MLVTQQGHTAARPGVHADPGNAVEVGVVSREIGRQQFLRTPTDIAIRLFQQLPDSFGVVMINARWGAEEESSSR